MIATGLTIEAESTGALLERAAAGDEVAFARIVARYHGELARVAYVVCGDLDIAQEAQQAAWAKAWTRLRDVRDADRLRPWLLSVAINEARQLARSQRRRVRREQVTFARGQQPDADQAALIDLADALARLEPRDRAIVCLRYLAGLASPEIARAVGMSASGVRVRLSRLLAHLREELGDG